MSSEQQRAQDPFVWHATHKRSKASLGTPDFWAGINRHAMWIEFKRDDSCKLSPEQEQFRLACEVQHVEHYIVYSAGEAIQIVEEAAHDFDSRDEPFEPSKRTRQDLNLE